MEMSFESIMAVGTGMVSRENVEEQDNTTVNYDGYADGTEADLTRTEEALHFADTYFKLKDMHSSEKLRMIKKINTAYNGKTIGNTNVANSVESFCNNAMSTEGIKEVAAKVKAKFIEIFKKIAEFFKNLIIKVVSAKYKGQIAEKIKTALKYDHEQMNVIIKILSSKPDDTFTEEYHKVLGIIQKNIDLDRKVLMTLLKYCNLSVKLAKKTGSDKKVGIDDVVDTDKISSFSDAFKKSMDDIKNVSVKDLRKKILEDQSFVAHDVNSPRYDGKNGVDEEIKTVQKVTESIQANLTKLETDVKDLEAKLKEAKDKKGAEAPASAAAEEPKA